MDKISLSSLIILFFLTSFLNPGIVQKENFSEKKIREEYQDLSRFKYCKQCHICVPKHLKYEHCNTCGICIQQKNHHDYIIGKCVGKYTCLIYFVFVLLLFFYLFRLALLIAIIFFEAIMKIIELLLF